MTDINKKYPRAISTCWQVPFDEWAKMYYEDSMFTNAIQGLICSVVFAYIVLLITTHNYTVSLFCILTILLTIGSIVCTIYLAGWGIGLSESICLIVFIGLSVDYVVHMSHQYIESIYDRRKNRVDNCFHQIGSTIVHGAITSLGASILLTQCLL